MNIPIYCNFYKWFLVEELVLTFPDQFHYGKCSVIGTLSIDSTNCIFLNNVKIKSVDSDYQLDSGDLQLKVIWAVCDQVPVYNTPVEVYAEAVFRNKAHHDKDAANILPWTVIDSLNELSHHPATSASQYWSSIKDKYEPALKIHSYRLITQLDRLIDCNLRLRIVDELNST